MPKRVGQQLVRRVVGRDRQGDAALRGSSQQTRNEHAIADVVDVKFVKEEHLNVIQQRVHRMLDGRRAAGMGTVGSGVEAAEEIVEMHPPFAHIELPKEAVHQPGLSPSHRSVQVKAPWHLPRKSPTPDRHLRAHGRQPPGCTLLAVFERKAGLSGVEVYSFEQPPGDVPGCSWSWPQEWRHSHPLRLKMTYMSSATPTMRPIAMG
ncbi:hypothetical protein PJL18_02560 [Paenarthrobacter nicotinovorans]|nr:hypothetical protein [Paenarthrobacter nicotinovorans]